MTRHLLVLLVCAVSLMLLRPVDAWELIIVGGFALVSAVALFIAIDRNYHK